MRSSVTKLFTVCVMVSVLGIFLVPSAGHAGPVHVQTFGNTDPFAKPGLKNTTLISVLVTDPVDGSTVANLGANVARDDTNGISLPTGWTLQNVIVPAGGCLFSTTQFGNLGNGYYFIRAKPFITNPACTWKEGDYPYVIHINVGGNKGSGLGVIESRIPNT